MQALDRRDRALPLLPVRVERHGFEYKRNGALSLYAPTRCAVRSPRDVPVTTSCASSAMSSPAASPGARSTSPCDNLSAHKDGASRRLPGRASQRRTTLPADPIVLAQSGRAVVLKSPARPCSRRVQLDRRPVPQAPRLHQRLLQERRPLFWKYSNSSRRIRHANPVSKAAH